MINLKEETLNDIDCIFLSYRDNSDDRNFLMLKLAEELNELSAELIQKALHPKHEEDNRSIEDEMGDVYFRFALCIKLYNMESIIARVNKKVKKAIDGRFDSKK